MDVDNDLAYSILRQLEFDRDDCVRLNDIHLRQPFSQLQTHLPSMTGAADANVDASVKMRTVGNADGRATATVVAGDGDGDVAVVDDDAED